MSGRDGNAACEAATSRGDATVPELLSGDLTDPRSRMIGRVCVVTGASSGIGYETALGLARMGATVVGVGRSPERCAAATVAIREASGSRSVSFEVADLASQQDIRALARRIEHAPGRVDVLINNAGVFSARRRHSPDGMELQLAVNDLAAFLLTHELLPLLSASPEARIIALSSGSHFAVDPGLVNTDMGLKEAGPLVRLVWLARRARGRTPAEGADTSIFLASDPAAPLDSGRYWKDRTAVPSSPASYDADTARRLWVLSARLTGSGAGGFRIPGT